MQQNKLKKILFLGDISKARSGLNFGKEEQGRGIRFQLGK